MGGHVWHRRWSMKDICYTIGIPTVKNSIVDKKDLSDAIRNHDREEEKKVWNKKLNQILNDYRTKPKDYMEKTSQADTRLVFRMRTEMLDVKDNMRGKYKGYSIYCEACDLKELQSLLSHVINCPGYAEVRVSKDMGSDEDMVAYLREVFLLRERRKCNK